MLSAQELTALLARTRDSDWFNRVLLPLAKEAKVAYAMVWQTYAQTSEESMYYVPFPGHPQAESFERFCRDSAVGLLR